MYGVVIVSRNLERANENDGFKMTALESLIIVVRVFKAVRILFHDHVTFNNQSLLYYPCMRVVQNQMGSET